jgi:hypothetical protein
MITTELKLPRPGLINRSTNLVDLLLSRSLGRDLDNLNLG